VANLLLAEEINVKSRCTALFERPALAKCLSFAEPTTRREAEGAHAGND